MSFLTTLALAVALLVVVPYLAHRLRRRRASELPFAPVRLVAAAPPKARQRSRLEDRVLFASRAALLMALAALGATPFVRCSRLSLQRSSGASIAMAIVVDDSMSMRATLDGRSRFDRARDGARELLASAREGDAVAIVLAGAPARVALAATTDLRTARRTIDALEVGDRATDLEEAIVIARDRLAGLPQVDRRVVLLSDLADGDPTGAPLGEGMDLPLWDPLPDLRGAKADCAVLRADRKGESVHVAIACGPGESAAGREVIVEDAEGKATGRAPASAAATEIVVQLPKPDAPAERARLSGVDAVASDDVAPVASAEARGTIAVVAQALDEIAATGGAPVVEQALAALKLDVETAPLPAPPDRAADYARHVGVILDDPPGLTPEQRRALWDFVQGGGVALIALGPRAAAAPLGATFEPLLSRAVSWDETRPSEGADPSSSSATLSAALSSLSQLHATRRAALAPDDAGAFEPLMRWDDGALLVARRALGRGVVWIATEPFSVDASDLPLRPGFLAILDAWAHAASESRAPLRSDVGTAWLFRGARDVRVEGPSGPLAVDRTSDGIRVVPSLLGAYRIAIDGTAEVRIAAPVVRELDLRPRAVRTSADGAIARPGRGSVDVSGPVAIALLGLMTVELVLRAAARRRVQAT